MDLTALRYFRAIAEHGSMGKAARALGVSQPTLTVAVQHLEAELGATLCDRDHSGVSLTPAGHALASHAKDVLHRVDLAIDDVRHLEHGPVGRFLVGCHPAVGAYFLPPLFLSFGAMHPGIELVPWPGTSARIHKAIIEREIHFGLAVNPPPHPDLVLVRLFRDAFDLFVAEQGAPRTAEHARERMLRGPLWFVDSIVQSHELIDRLAVDGLAPNQRVDCGELALVRGLTAAGLGVGLLPRRVANLVEHERLQRLDHDLPFITDSLHLIYRADLHRTHAANLLKDAIVAHGRALDEGFDAP